MPTTTLAKDKKNQTDAVDISEQLEQLKQDIASLTKTVADYGKDNAETLKQEAKNKGIDATETAQQAAETVRDEILDVEKDIEAYVRSNPLQAVGIATGVGFLFAMILGYTNW